MSRVIKFLIVDDQKLIRDVLTERLQSLFENAEVFETASGREAPTMVAAVRPDIIFMDISMPDMNGVEATRNVLLQFPLQKIIAFSMNDNDEMLNRMMNAGALGYLLKTDDTEDYQVAIDSVLSGQTFISRNIKK